MISSSNMKKKKKYETALAAIFPENDQSYSQYSQDYADGFMKKMRERLDEESFNQAVKLLAAFNDADSSNINLLYQQLIKIFTSKNEDLSYEFLGFLLPGQALAVGKISEYLELTRIKEFIRKLQVCMKKQPTQVRKIMDNLYHLSQTKNVTPSEVHLIMLPLLKSNPILVDCFFQLFPSEHPPESFFSDDNWEDLDIDKSINSGIDCEDINPLDSEDTTCFNVCHCGCHKNGVNSHCKSCGLKFFKGRIYFDTPEGLKLAKIKFEGADQNVVQSKFDKTEESVTVKQKSRKALTKNHSPGSAEDIKGSTGTESEEDLIDVKPKKRQKSKVVQSLKLKFKKEESPKCKDEQEMCVESGKSIVHVNNEQLNSSEMVFFCIPNFDSKVAITPMTIIKPDIKENGLMDESEVNKITRINFDIPVVNSNFFEKEVKTETTTNINNFLEINRNLSSDEIKQEDCDNNKHCQEDKKNLFSDDKEALKQSTDTTNNNAEKCDVPSKLETPGNEKITYESIKCKSEYEPKNLVLNVVDLSKRDDKPTIIQPKIEYSTTEIKSSNNNTTMRSQDNNIQELPNINLDIVKHKKDLLEEQAKNKWTIDEDKIILQTCKRVEDIEVLLETIKRRIPQRSVSEIQARYTTLMTLLKLTRTIDVKQT
ncbi:uncharacterized protein LOC126844250 isoform X2 [Adelges cooleyi]|nr:uncharacterized protein LOC126844250 isoform X2 [Adelges cooleyi]